MKILQAFSILASAVVLSVTAAQAEKLALATFVEPNHPITRYQHMEFADRVREASKGELDFEVFTGGSLMPVTGTLEGVASGVAQASVFPPSYAPSALPVVNAINDIGWLSPDPLVLALAYADFNFNEEAPKNDWKKNGVLYGAGHATPLYRIMCKDDKKGLADLTGVKTRMPGSSYVRFGDTIGLTAVSMPASEIYTGLERGALDCAIGDVTHLQSGATIGDLVGSIITLKMSPYFTSAGLLYNREFWQSLRDDQRRLLLDEGGRSMVRLTMAYLGEEKQALEWAKGKGIAIHEPDAELQAAFDKFVQSDVGDMTGYAKTKFGIEDPRALFDNVLHYIDKWNGLLARIDRNDQEAVFALVKAEITDKVDVTKYGID